MRPICIMACAPRQAAGAGRHPWRHRPQCLHSANGQVLSAFGLRLKGIMPARLRLAAAAHAAQKAARHSFPPRQLPRPPWSALSCKIKPRSASSGTERRSGAYGPRQPAPGRPFTGPQTSCVPAQRRAKNPSETHRKYDWQSRNRLLRCGSADRLITAWR